jgi:hypothetical protein
MKWKICICGHSDRQRRSKRGEKDRSGGSFIVVDLLFEISIGGLRDGRD